MPFSKVKTTILKPLKINEYGKVETVGEHIRLRRFKMCLLQKDVAKIIGVSEDTITFWERNRTNPNIRYMPKIVEFLGYNPVSLDNTNMAGKILEFRILNGLTYKAMGKLSGVNATTIALWEQNKSSPSGHNLRKLFDRLKCFF